jgi:hypothetical protein
MIPSQLRRDLHTRGPRPGEVDGSYHFVAERSSPTCAVGASSSSLPRSTGTGTGRPARKSLTRSGQART